VREEKREWSHKKKERKRAKDLVIRKGEESNDIAEDKSLKERRRIAIIRLASGQRRKRWRHSYGKGMRPKPRVKEKRGMVLDRDQI